MGFLDRLKQGLLKTKKGLTEKIEAVFSSGQISEDSLDELEEILISSDFGVSATDEIMSHLRANKGSMKDYSSLREFFKGELSSLLGKSQPVVEFDSRPFVIMVVGVNGSGKTTTIGKLASRFASEGRGVVLAAADTFRAAAIEQLEVWGQRAGVQVIKHQPGSDPAAVAFDAVEAAKHRDADVVIIDTAGRLHTKSPLMEELKKVKRVMRKSMPDAPHEVLLVLDATTGQNGLRQAHVFNEAVGITGIVLTKLDGTARGGIVFAIKKDIGIPVRLIGIGERMEDLRDFNAKDFIDALFD